MQDRCRTGAGQVQDRCKTGAVSVSTEGTLMNFKIVVTNFNVQALAANLCEDAICAVKTILTLNLNFNVSPVNDYIPE